MSAPQAPFKVAAAQLAPVFLDREATVAKACDWIARAGAEGVKLVVFPEAFVPGYPDWLWCLAPRERKQLDALYAELLANAVTVGDDATRRLAAAARAAGTHVAIGIHERNAEASGTTLYNALLFIDDHGEVLGCHRKLVPTGAERLVWAQGDGSTLRVYDTAVGRLGGLICWENYMPLARYAMTAWGMQILVAATWDRGEPWVSTLRHVAKETRAFVIGCCQALHRDDIPDRHAFKALYPADRTWINVGDSAIVSPDGQFLAGPVREQEALLTAVIDPAQMSAGRWMFDAAGHYARPDVFELTVHRTPRPMMTERAPGEGEPLP